MAGGSYRHTLIRSNLVCELGMALKKKPVMVLSHEMRTRITSDYFTYPDVLIAPINAKFVDNRSDTLLNPTVLIEVLSPSTEAHDRGFKAAQYRTLEGLQEYAFVSQNEARVEIHRRHGPLQANEWLLIDTAGIDASCEFTSLECRVPLAEIYDKVDFTAD